MLEVKFGLQQLKLIYWKSNLDCNNSSLIYWKSNLIAITQVEYLEVKFGLHNSSFDILEVKIVLQQLKLGLATTQT
jgi:hypothetical protein